MRASALRNAEPRLGGAEPGTPTRVCTEDEHGLTSAVPESNRGWTLGWEAIVLAHREQQRERRDE